MDDPGREIWRETRRHLQDYEARNAELNLDMQAAARALGAAKEELSSLQRECQTLRNTKDASDRGSLDEHDKLTTLQRKREELLAESSRLTLQVSSLRDELEAARSMAAEQEHEREAHVAELQAYLNRLVSYLAGGGTAGTATATAATEGGPDGDGGRPGR